MENNILNSLFDEGKIEKIEQIDGNVEIVLMQETNSYMIANGFRIEDNDSAYTKVLFINCSNVEIIKDDGEYGYVKKTYADDSTFRVVCENLILSFDYERYEIKKVYTLGDK